MLLKSPRRRAAQYVRMSTDSQELSIANQQAEIGRYAERFGYEIVQTYRDEGKSGVRLKCRTAGAGASREHCEHWAPKHPCIPKWPACR
jgi:hypothetical protein